MNNIVLYGIGGASDSYRIFRYWRFTEEQVSIKEIVYQACVMVGSCPSIRQVYVIDNSGELFRDYKRVLKYPSIENNVIFKSVLENRGLLVYETKKNEISP